jgi:hypothetical protein
MLVLVLIRVVSPHMIGVPVYITHLASNTSEHGSGSGHPAGVGHGAGVTKASSHPQFLHLVSAIIFGINQFFE